MSRFCGKLPYKIMTTKRPSYRLPTQPSWSHLSWSKVIESVQCNASISGKITYYILDGIEIRCVPGEDCFGEIIRYRDHLFIKSLGNKS
jgi:hypothetical protein